MLRSSLLLAAAAVMASEEPIAGYKPGSDVVQHSRIDLDMDEMLTHLKGGDLESAYEIYSKGGHSGARAKIALSEFPDVEITKGSSTIVKQGNNKIGYVKSVDADNNVIEVTYTSIKNKECEEGGKSQKNSVGCFNSEEADITIEQQSGLTVIPRSTIASVTNTYRTIQGFSTQAEKKMTGQQFFQQYKTYFGRGDYGDNYVRQALDRDSALFFAKDQSMRSEVSKKGAVYMNIWMYVIREMEDAINDCNSDCELESCNDDPVHAWDEAVAFYVGSKARNGDKYKSKETSGVLLYALADKRCKNFGTCNEDQIAEVNVQIMEEFTKGQELLRESKCFDVVAVKNRIVNLMTIPLLQGALRYAYIVDRDNTAIAGSATPKAVAEGFIFAEAILPRLASCNPADARIIVRNQGELFYSEDAMKDGFEAVKAAYERSYECLGITCKDVGGLEAAKLGPCRDASTLNPEEIPESPKEKTELVLQCISLLSTLA